MCKGHPLKLESFAAEKDSVREGVLVCSNCGSWYVIEDFLLELLPPEIAYEQDRRCFIDKHATKLRDLGLETSLVSEKHEMQEQVKQQHHSDWYADNEIQTYADYADTPFWKAADDVAFERWRPLIDNGWLLDVGCANGRSTFKIADLPVNIIGFDVSKLLVKQAIARAAGSGNAEKCWFFVGDATSLPFASGSFDYVLIYGVLHHLPDPRNVCREIARVLKPGGRYFGQENNASVLRRIFDLLQKVRPEWYEEAGEHALASRADFLEWFKGNGIDVSTRTSVLLPPHLINLLGQSLARRSIQFTDKIFLSLPYFRDHGGLILVDGKKVDDSSPSPAGER